MVIRRLCAIPFSVCLLFGGVVREPAGHVGALVEALAELGSDTAYPLPVPMSTGKGKEVCRSRPVLLASLCAHISARRLHLLLVHAFAIPCLFVVAVF